MRKALAAVALALAASAIFADASVEAHAAVARRAAADGIVLLKNDGSLPLAKGSTLALFGATDDIRPGGGGSSGVNAVRRVTLADGLTEAGFKLDQTSRETALFVVMRNALEGEDAPDAAFELAGEELATLAEIKASGFKRIVAVCGGGHVFDFGPLADDAAVDAILWAWYPGGEGCAAIGDVLAGKVNPSARLAETIARNVGDYPTDRGWRESRWYVPYEEGIFVGYRYFETIPGADAKVLYPFGHGLSYTTFELGAVEVKGFDASALAADGAARKIAVAVTVTNTGRAAGRHSVLCYTSQRGGLADHPSRELRAFAKTSLLAPGASERLTLSFDAKDLAFFDDDETSPAVGSWVFDKGRYSLLVGGSVRDAKEEAAFDAPACAVLASPGLKLQADRLARQLRADGSFKTLNTIYPGHVEPGELVPVRTNSQDRVNVTLFDVADGRATLDDLLDDMSLKEMLHLLFGHLREDPCGTGSIGALDKFRISAVQTCDGPAGVRREAASTFFPCAALLACTFDTDLIRETGATIGDEAAEAGFDLLLAPGMCIHRHPLCGRNFEYFSEDPLVSGVAAAAYVKGVQSRGVGATLKHFAGNGRETTRRIQKDVASERAFREIYLRGFERAVKEAEPWAVMTSYNGVNGYNSGENYGLVTGILRDEWGYKGLAVTDWLTTIPMWREIGAGNDVKMPKDIEDTNRNMLKRGDAVEEALFAYNRCYLSLTRVRESAKRVCELVMKSRRFARDRARRPVLELKPGPDNPRNSEGAFMPLKDGSIIYAYSRYRGASKGDHAPAEIAVRRSNDGGATWSATDEIIVRDEGAMNVMSVSLLRLKSGEIALFYLRKNSLADCRPVMRRSFDEGKTWSGPTTCITDETAYYVLNNDRVVQLESGRLLFAVSKHSFPDGKFDNTGVVLTYSSDDNGATWHRGKSVLEVRGADGRRYAAQEPGVVECSDGSILLWIRTNSGRQYFSRSTDRGETWSEPEPSPLVSPLSPASIKRLPTGDLLAVWNDHGSRPEMKTYRPTEHKWANGWRSPLAAALSSDDGRTWHGVKMLETDPDGWFCYTAIQPLADGTVLLGYCAYDMLAHTRLVKVPLKWFYEN